jgi:PAS domain S-box-containing protein
VNPSLNFLDEPELTSRILDTVDIELAIFDENLRYVYVSKSAMKDPEIRSWVIGKTNKDYMRKRNKPVELAEKREAMIRQSFTENIILEFQESFLNRDDKVVYYKRIIHPVSDNSGNVKYVVGYGLDITDSLTMERQIRDDLTQYQSLFINSPIGIAIYRDRTVIVTNPALNEIMGEDVTNKEWLSIVHPEERTKLIDYHIKRSKGIPVPGNYETKAVKSNGTEIAIQVEISDINLVDGPAGLAFIRDITKRKEAEEDRLQRLKIESLSLLAGGIAHDYNNILVGILGNVNLLSQLTHLDDEVQQTLMDLESATLRASDLTKQLLTFAKGGQPVKSPIDIAQVVKDSVSLMMRGSKSRYEIHIFDELPTIEVDVGQISQMLNNLIINANQAMPDGGLLNVKVGVKSLDKNGEIPLPFGDYIKIDIQDEGIGISPANLKKIFDPYFTTKPTGSGLGLATSYSIVKQHGGEISVSSIENNGTKFTLYLPITGIQLETERKSVNESRSYSGKILLMDDDQTVQITLKKMLVRLGFSVDLVSNGTDCLSMYSKSLEENKAYELLIMDLTIAGGMGGKEAISELLKIDPKAKAIVSSGYSNDPILAKYDEYGFKAALHKPYSLSELEQTINRVISIT